MRLKYKLGFSLLALFVCLFFFRGSPSPEGAFPYSAIVRINLNKRFICSGTVISKDYVLTAAHCLGGKGKLTVSSRSGLHAVTIVGVSAPDGGLLKGDFRDETPATLNTKGLGNFIPAVMVCGYPMGQRQLLCTRAYPKGNDGFFIHARGLFLPGMSGSPVFNPETAAIVGIATGAYFMQQGGGVAISPTAGILAAVGVEP